MTRDRSLDEFARADEESDGDDAAPEPGDTDAGADAAAGAAGADSDDPEPARTTYAFSPEGAACAACGETVETRWRDDKGLVCSACKEW